MPYNPELDSRIKNIISNWEKSDRKKMFGGTCYLLNGNMLCGVYKDYLILRLGEEQAAKSLHQENAKPFEITGRPMRGWVMVDEKEIKTDQQLIAWLQKARDFVNTLSPKITSGSKRF